MRTKNVPALTENSIAADLESAILGRDVEGIVRALNVRAALPYMELANRLQQAEQDIVAWRQRLAWAEQEQKARAAVYAEAKKIKGRFAVDEMNAARQAGERVGTCTQCLGAVQALPAKIREVIRITATGHDQQAANLLRQADLDASRAKTAWEGIESAERNAGRPVVLPGEAVKAA